jgi:sulfhydrogenase subunit beta (sulfur reductase)
MGPALMYKKQFEKMLQAWLEDYRLVAPVREGEQLLFKEIKKLDELVLSDELPYRSPKEFLFPQIQKLMTFDDQGELVVHEESPKTLVFGVKPCDLETIQVLKAVFTQGPYQDPFFIQALENTLFVGVGCMEEKPGCFCSERGIRKDYSSSCDVFLQPEEDGYLIRHLSEKGSSLMKEWVSGALPIESEEMPGETSETDRILEIRADEDRVFHEPDWDEISERCMGCGICTYICPTCHCFTFKDVHEKGRSSRYRLWDSCMYPKFTLHASGHNPRPSRKERFRQRVMHKYVFIPKNFGYTACSGCGRCIRSCPAGMNIKTVVSGIMGELT